MIIQLMFQAMAGSHGLMGDQKSAAGVGIEWGDGGVAIAVRLGSRRSW